ncbi:cupredoxin domain-containing protein [Sutcliffiella halmapala]|uniref:cupredoxin domain-containing protein n=1 Tax=Sutcliffiella halmapala TaxID=79882 RepID=UPI000994E323|nr:cupredoxin domain-containing protein [Sutcliffiella halmapala]
MRFFIVKKSWIVTVMLCFIVALGGWYIVNVGIIPTTGKPTQENKLTYHMITSEFKTTLADGTEIEAYRFDPGTITVPKGKDITISIIGVNGSEHPYTIEGTDISGVIKKGEETIINTRFDKPGVYQIICTTHSDHASHSHHKTPPMIAYIYVY